MRTATSSPAGRDLPDLAEASIDSQSARAPGAGAPARLAAAENLRQPAAEHPAAEPNSASGATCQPRDGSTARSSAGSASSRVARRRFFALVRAAAANSRCDDRMRDLCQDFGHASSRNQAAIGMTSGLGSVLSKKAAMASAGTL